MEKIQIVWSMFILPLLILFTRIFPLFARSIHAILCQSIDEWKNAEKIAQASLS